VDSPGLLRGRLLGPSAAPDAGELVRRLVGVRNLVVEEIVGGRLEAAAEYEQEQDEWVALLAGRAVLEVGGEEIELAPGDWLFLPAGLRHVLREAEPGSQWLAVHLHPG
jgi:cupin 2 domain-containing protein